MEEDRYTEADIEKLDRQIEADLGEKRHRSNLDTMVDGMDRSDVGVTPQPGSNETDFWDEPDKQIYQGVVISVLDEFFDMGFPDLYQVACNVFGPEVVSEYYAAKAEKAG